MNVEPNVIAVTSEGARGMVGRTSGLPGQLFQGQEGTRKSKYCRKLMVEQYARGLAENFPRGLLL